MLHGSQLLQIRVQVAPPTNPNFHEIRISRHSRQKQIKTTSSDNIFWTNLKLANNLGKLASIGI